MHIIEHPTDALPCQDIIAVVSSPTRPFDGYSLLACSLAERTLTFGVVAVLN
jgi:hypothetical protein